MYLQLVLIADEVMVVEDVPNSTNDTDLKMKLIDEPDICTSTQYGNDIIYHMLEQEVRKKIQ